MSFQNNIITIATVIKEKARFDLRHLPKIYYLFLITTATVSTELLAFAVDLKNSLSPCQRVFTVQ